MLCFIVPSIRIILLFFSVLHAKEKSGCCVAYFVFFLRSLCDSLHLFVMFYTQLPARVLSAVSVQ